MRPRLLDLFCGAGGCSVGYERAGFEVVGVDIVPQPRYPFEFIPTDALSLMQRFVAGGWVGRSNDGQFSLTHFDAIHASPPCPVHSTLTGWGQSRRIVDPAVDLIPQTRELLRATGLPYVIENVKRKALVDPVKVCGQSLGLEVRRHRWFETNWSFMAPPCHHPGPPVIVVQGSIGRKVFDPRRKATAPTLDHARAIMEMPEGSALEVANAIPPAYTELIGHQLLQHIRQVAA